MSVQPILVFGEPRLEAPNAPVENFDKALETLVADLFETGWRAPGLGLAAPQIGVNLRLATVDLSVGKNPSQRIVLANPTIIESSGTISLEEGCLSFPGCSRPSPDPENSWSAPGGSTEHLWRSRHPGFSPRRSVTRSITSKDGSSSTICAASRRRCSSDALPR